MIYVDEVRNYGQKGGWSHMWTDGDETDLHEFAKRLGLKREWVHISHSSTGPFVHYDLRPSKRTLALSKGATFKPLSEWIRERRVAQE